MLPVEPITAQTASEDIAPILEAWKDGLVVVGDDRVTDQQFVGLLAHRPELLKTVLDHYATFLGHGTLPVRLKELVRIATADAIGCSEYCVNIRLAAGRAAGVTEGDVRAARALDADALAPGELAALRYAGQFVRNPRALDERYAECKEHFTDEQIVELGIACATFLGFGTMVVAFGLRAGLDSPLARRAEPVA